MLFWEAFMFGFFQSFAIGPISLYGIREGLNPRKGIVMQLQVIFGAALVELIYLGLATNGITGIMNYEWVQTLLWIAAAYMLGSMGYHSLKEPSSKGSLQHMHRHRLRFFDSDFFKGFLMCICSPMALVFCFIVVGGMYTNYATQVSPMEFALSVNIGGITTMLLITAATFAVRHVFHKWMLTKLVRAGSLILIGYGMWFAWKAVLGLQPLVVAFIS